MVSRRDVYASNFYIICARRGIFDLLNGAIYNSNMPKSNTENPNKILALGPESAGSFAIYSNGEIYFSSDFGDLLDGKNFQKFKKTILNYLKENKIKPDIILTDLHPLYKTTIWGKQLAKKYKAKYVQVQHHLAHIFSAVGEKIFKSKILNPKFFVGIACDGTGYGADGKIWGGEIFNIKCQMPNAKIERIGCLENQTMLGADLAIKEPARMLIAILEKTLSLRA